MFLFALGLERKWLAPDLIAEGAASTSVRLCAELSPFAGDAVGEPMLEQAHRTFPLGRTRPIKSVSRPCIHRQSSLKINPCC